MSKSKIIVTGGAGFIGSHLTDRLIKLGREVLVIDDLSLGQKEFVNRRAEFKRASITNLPALKRLFRDASAVFHLAADPRLLVSIDDPVATHAVNVSGTLNVLEAARFNKVKKIIFSSSCAVYGEQKLPISETSIPDPQSPYGLQKLIGERYCRLYSKLYGIKTVCLRYFNVFGPRKLATGSYPMVIPIFLSQKKAGKKLTIVGDGKSTRDYVSVYDVVDANLSAWQSNVSDGRAVNIGSGRQISVMEIAKLIGGATSRLSARSGEMRRAQADISLARNLLGWKPTVKLEDGIAELKKEWGLT